MPLNVDKRLLNGLMNKCLPYKHKGPGLISRTHVKLLGWCHALVIQRQEDPWSLLAGQSGPISELQASVRPFLKRGGQCFWGGHWRLSSGLHVDGCNIHSSISSVWGWNDGLVVENTCCSFRESQFVFLAPTWWFATICNSSSKGLDSLFWPPRVPAMQVAHLPHVAETSYALNLKFLLKIKWRKEIHHRDHIECNFEMLVVCHNWFLQSFFKNAVVYLCVCPCVHVHMWGGQRATRGSWFYPLPMWVP